MPLISLHVDQGIGVLHLQRQEKRCALNRDMLLEMEEALAGLGGDPQVRVLVVRGGDQAFCAGADLGEVKNLTSQAMVQGWIELGHRVFNVLASLPMPTMAAMRGYALGGGLELALACDFRLAAADAILGLPEVGHGWIPGWGGTSRLPRLVGEARAKELILLGRRLDAQEAERWGLVHRLIPVDRFDQEVRQLAEELAAKNPTALRVSKAILSHQLSQPEMRAEIDGSLACLAKNFSNVLHSATNRPIK